jgi:FMN phosphatase YigB (HAD superfamily)
VTPKRPVEAVLWDVEGTLVVRGRSAVEIAVRELTRHGVDPSGIAPPALDAAQCYLAERIDLWDQQAEIAGFREAVRLLLGPEARTSPSLVDDLAEAFATAYDAFEPVDGIGRVLGKVRSLGIRQGVVSNWPGSLGRFLEHVGLAAHLDVVVSSGTEGILKPDPRLFERALERLEIPPTAAVVVGNDLTHDITPARGLGCATVHFDPTARSHASITTAAALEPALSAILLAGRDPAVWP